MISTCLNATETCGKDKVSSLLMALHAELYEIENKG